MVSIIDISNTYWCWEKKLFYSMYYSLLLACHWVFRNNVV